MNKKILILVFLISLIIFSCSKERKAWQEAEFENTVLEYEYFLKKYPQGNRAAIANMRLEQLYGDRHTDFRNTKTIRIIVNESYGKGMYISLPFKLYASSICKFAGLHIELENAVDYDVTLKIQVYGGGIGADYKGVDYSGGYFKTGASLSGSISLEIPGLDPYKKIFSGKKPPLKTIINEPGPIRRALITSYQEAFRKSDFLSKLIAIMGEFYGIHTLTNIFMRYDDPYVRKAAFDELMNVKDPRSVGPLITALRYKRYKFYRPRIERLLKDITGINSSMSPSKWKNWWKENKEGFLRKK